MSKFPFYLEGAFLPCTPMSELSIKEILREKDHRPWPLPEKDWSFYQEWNKALFLHWMVEKEELRKLVPKDLDLDEFDRSCWISAVAFRMEQIRPKYMPAFAPISNFLELNIRTYVSYKGRPGVYFLSIEGGNAVSCALSRSISGLPYRFSEMVAAEGKFESKGGVRDDHFKARFKLGDEIQSKSELDEFLTERYTLFLDQPGGIDEFEIHHLPWEMNEVELSELQFDYQLLKSFNLGKPDRSAYSKGVQVVAWGKRKHR